MTASRGRLRSVPANAGRAVLYVRVSKLAGRKGDDFHSPDLQIAAMRRMVVANGLREVDVVSDIDVSGRGFVREGLDKIRAMVEAGELDVVAVYDLSRLGRNTAESLRFITWLRDHKVAVISTVEQVQDTPEGQFTLGMFLGMAEMFSNQMGRRWSSVIERRADEQGLAHGRAPMGYRKFNKGMEVDPDLGPLITAMFKKYADGSSISDICRVLTAARSINTNRVRVKRMLTNRVYLGEVSVRGGWTSGVHTRLIDDETWAICQRRLAEDSRLPPRVISPGYSLTGLMYCAACGRRGAVWPSRKGKGGEIVLRAWCRQLIEGAHGCRGFGTPLLADIEEEVLVQLSSRVRELAQNPTMLAESMTTAALGTANLGRLEKQLVTTQAAMAKITTQWGLNQMPDAAYQGSMADLSVTEAEIIDQIKLARTVRPTRPPAQILAVAKELLALWPEMDGPQRNRALRDDVSGIIIRRAVFRREPIKGRVIVTWR